MPMIIGHQGSSEGTHAPGTRGAFDVAIASGADAIEVDVRSARGGAFVACHDEFVESRPVSSLTPSDLCELARGAAPLLEAVLLRAQNAGVAVMLDLKEVGREHDVLDLTSSIIEFERVIVSTLEAVSVATIRRLRPDVDVGLSLGRDLAGARLGRRVLTRTSELLPLLRAWRCGAQFLSIHHQLALAGVLAQAHTARLRTFVWTVDDERVIRQLLRDSRIHGIITNRPALAVALRSGP
jgi:glycerophosphoryl diester phosphodiesterase